MADDELLDLNTQEEVKTFLNAEEVYGDRLVAKVIRTVWDRENDDVWLWSFNGCSRCERELVDDQEGYVWPRPLGDKPESQYCSMVTFCSEECVETEIKEWAATFERDLLIAWYTL